ncbi:MAG: DUF4255 domain-containing protein [Verrucomicrobiota bacterium]
MIHDALQLIANQLNAALPGTGGARSVILGNIAQVESETKDELKQVVLSLVNVEEESALKNGPHSRLKNGQVIYENRPVCLHLYLLFSANNTDYGTALKRLESIIEFFQGRNVFTVRNSPELENLSRTAEELASFRLTLELHSLSFEQINHLWGSLGGKQVPFILYRARLVSLSAREFRTAGPPIEEVSVELESAIP